MNYRFYLPEQGLGINFETSGDLKQVSEYALKAAFGILHYADNIDKARLSGTLFNDDTKEAWIVSGELEMEKVFEVKGEINVSPAEYSDEDYD